MCSRLVRCVLYGECLEVTSSRKNACQFSFFLFVYHWFHLIRLSFPPFLCFLLIWCNINVFTITIDTKVNQLANFTSTYFAYFCFKSIKTEEQNETWYYCHRIPTANGWSASSCLFFGKCIFDDRLTSFVNFRKRYPSGLTINWNTCFCW